MHVLALCLAATTHCVQCGHHHHYAYDCHRSHLRTVILVLDVGVLKAAGIAEPDDSERTGKDRTRVTWL